MNPVIVRKVKIGDGIPKICVPVVGRNLEEIIGEAMQAKSSGADLVEWRADWYEDLLCQENLLKTLGELRNVLDELPFLFTVRTADEGGEAKLQKEAYTAILKTAMESQKIDLVDVEMFAGEDVVKELIEEAKKQQIFVIMSNHDFNKTPEQKEIVARLRKMQDLGADILKIAVMPQERKDVLTLLSATEEMVSQYAKQPVVSMSMSQLGVISRVAGEVFGSAITFGSAGKESAPGQVSVQNLRQMLEDLHEII